MYEDAYRVPFRLERRPPEYRLVNEGDEPVHGVAVTVHGAGMLAANSPAKLQPGEALEVTISGERLERASILVVRWFRPDGVEYLWRASL
ncbi:MAG: hypothetical protein BGO97_01790 [Micrococcales bacterium 70-64]|nr:hypothetical protein [Leifsonia sp.]ODU65942.1 MAG: hypothetical protein ABT06_01795 [Leifsonia sp. SCN 70-46]OJX84568.1 MAG: hypothetical protein BGO97_01790 [Micrococcales bacterium 70-64]